MVRDDLAVNDELRAALAGSDVHFIDPLAKLCEGSSCPYRKMVACCLVTPVISAKIEVTGLFKVTSPL